MLTNADITIFNRFANRQEKKIIYIPHYIENVWFHAEHKIAVTDGGVNSADVYKIRIPCEECREWVSERDFANMSSVAGGWTVQNGDMFLVGKWSGGNVSGIEEIKREFSGVIGKVLSHSENFFGSSRHIRIGGGA